MLCAVKVLRVMSLHWLFRVTSRYIKSLSGKIIKNLFTLVFVYSCFIWIILTGLLTLYPVFSQWKYRSFSLWVCFFCYWYLLLFSLSCTLSSAVDKPLGGFRFCTYSNNMSMDSSRLYIFNRTEKISCAYSAQTAHSIY